MNFFKLTLFFLLFLHTSLYAKDQKLEKITLQLQWKHQFEFAGFYAAKEKGFYKDVGLDVTFVEFDKNKNIIDELLNGNAEYGLTYSSVIVEYLKGKPLVLIANFFKQSPLVLVAQEEIKSPADLKGKKVMGVSDSIDNITLLTMLDKFEVNTDNIINVSASFNIDAFVDKRVDAMSVFTTNELYQLNQRGVKYNIFDPIAYGSKYYDVNLFSSKDEVTYHPDRVEKFRSASVKGWEYALSHHEEIIDLIIQKYNSQKKSKEALHFEAKQIEQIMLPNIYEIGSIDIDRVKVIADIFLQAGFIDNVSNQNLEDFIYTYKQNPLGLTKNELAFIKDHPQIILGTDKTWKPYVIPNSDGTISGYDADVLALINTSSGANFVLKPDNWADMQIQAKSKKIDGLSTGGIHEERKRYLNFSDIYISMQKMLITSKENPQNIHTLQDLDGKIIAVHNSNLVDMKIAQKFPKSKIMHLNSVEEVISSVVTGKADTMFGNGAVFYLANELGMPYLKRSAKLDDTLELAFGIRKDWPEAISIINKALAYIGRYKLLELKNKWFGSHKATVLLEIYKKLQLKDKEKKYLLQKKAITMCTDPDWMPFEKIVNNKHIGISAEYIQVVASKIGIPITLVPTTTWSDSITFVKERKCDILSLAMETPERKKYMDFTKPYLTVPLVITTTHDKFFISDLNELQEESIGIGKNYAQAELLKIKYPLINFVEVATTKEGLEQVIDGTLFGYIDNRTTIGYRIQKFFPTELKITGQFDEKLTLGIGVRNDEPELLTILNKAINTIDERTKERILNQWVTVKYEQGADYRLFWYIVIPILLLALVLTISQYILRQYNKKLKNDVAQKVEELRQKDEALLSKHRMAAMGEMLSMIAHQWRQPLGAISSAVIGIELKIANNKFDLDNKNNREKFLAFLERKHHNINDYVQYLSSTTDDFRNFFNPNKSKDTVSLTSPIERALNIVLVPMQNRGIEIIKDLQVDTELALYQNEVMQVMLNLLKNSEDNFLEKEISHPKITLATYIDNNHYIIRLCDNGGGIPKEHIDKIFDPYFSTKNEKNGAGLGLYMSKIIIEDHHNGILTMQNTKDGVCFEIKFIKQK